MPQGTKECRVYLERRLGRLSDALVFAINVADHRLVAQRAHLGQIGHVGGRCKTHNVALWHVRGASNLVLLKRGGGGRGIGNRHHSHLIGGECTSLVGAEDIHAGDLLQGRKIGDNGAFPRHLLGADGESDRQHHR